MKKIGAIFKKIWRWILDNPWAIIASVIGVFSAYFILKSKNNKISDLKDAVAVQSTMKRIAADEARANALKEQADASEEEIKGLDAKIAASKRRVVEIHEGKPIKDSSDEEVARMFSQSGL